MAKLVLIYCYVVIHVTSESCVQLHYGHIHPRSSQPTAITQCQKPGK